MAWPDSAATRRALLAMAGPAWANTRPIRIILPFPPGGALDAVMRLVAPGMSQRLGQAMLVDNRPGALGLIGAEAAARAAPDGQTLLLTADMLVQAPILLGNTALHALRDFTPIGRLGSFALALTIGPAVPPAVRDIAGFLAWARGRRVTLGNWSTGGTGHLLGLLLAREQGLDVLHVGYRGEPPMASDLLGGRMDGGFVTTTSFGEAMRAGRLRPLVSTGTQRIPSLAATVPTLSEAGLLRNFGYRGFVGLFGPAGMEPALATRIDRALAETMAEPAVAGMLRDMDFFLEHAGPADFATHIAETELRWRDFAAAFDLRADLQ
jgi:tripartite-type tricarboxylate transporter receptor subunit TctC